MNRIHIILLGIFCVFLCTGFFIIKEGERGIVLRLGKIVQNRDKTILIYTPGLHYKFPLIEVLKRVNCQIQTTENRSRIFILKGKKNFFVDFYIKWKIHDIGRYYLSTKGNNVNKIDILLKQKFNGILLSAINKLNNSTIITDKIHLLNNNILKKFNFYSFIFSDSFQKSSLINQKTFITKNKNDNTECMSLKKLMNTSDIIDLGIKVIDISINKIILSISELNEMYNRIKLENESIAKNEILKGQIIAKKIKLKADYTVIKILSEAKRKQLIIQGEAEAISMRLLFSLFIKQPNFYQFLRIFQYDGNIFNTDKKLIKKNTDNFFYRHIENIR